VSKVWFSIADGVLTETMYGLIHEAQIKQMRIAVQTATGLAVEGATHDLEDRIPARRRRRPAAVAGLQDHHHRQAGPLRDREADLHRSRPQRPVRARHGEGAEGAGDAVPGAGAAHGQHRRRRHGSAGATALTAYEGKAFLSLKGTKPFVKAVASVAEGQRRPVAGLKARPDGGPRPRARSS
jgi:glucoamylase